MSKTGQMNCFLNVPLLFWVWRDAKHCGSLKSAEVNLLFCDWPLLCAPYGAVPAGRSAGQGGKNFLEQMVKPYVVV